MARFSDLPLEVVEEIMSWLPPESLRRFKLVQKSWYLQIHALVDDPAFVAKHLRNMKKKRLSSSLCRFSGLITGPEIEHPVEEVEEEDDEEGDDEYERYFLILANNDFSGFDNIPCDTNDLVDLKICLERYCFKIVSQCDGIICLYVELGRVVCLLNPALREMKVIHCPCYEDDENYDVEGVGFAFGHDSRKNEYKVVAITALTRVDEDEEEALSIAEVYSLQTDSWREIRLDFDFQGECSQVYCNGACYWYHYLEGGGLYMISFDFSDEVFRHVPLPDEMYAVKDWENISEWTSVCVWKESVVLFVFPKKAKKVIDMWVLNSQRVGIEGSYVWTKHVTIGPLKGTERPLGFWGDDELFLEGDEEEIMLYHLGSKVVSHVPKRLKWYNYDYFVIYQKSLVSVLRKEGRTSVVQV